MTVGFLIGTDTAIAAKANPDVKFVGVDQGICVDAEGVPDPTFACAGDAATLLPNYQGIVFAEAQPGYLAGIVAASLSKTRHDRCRRRDQRPGRRQLLARLRERRQVGQPGHQGPLPGDRPEPGQVGFNDQAKGRAIAGQFIGQDADVLFQVAGLTGVGVLEAACDADLIGIGVDVDQAVSLPNLAKCIVTSAEKKLKDTVQAVVTSVASDTFQAGTVVYNAASTPPAIGLSPITTTTPR